MKGIRFYLEHKTTYAKRKRRHAGTVFAAFVCNGVHPMKGGGREGVGAVFDRPNSPTCGTSASWGYLRSYCRRITEKDARAIHPELFRILDRKDD